MRLALARDGLELAGGSGGLRWSPAPAFTRSLAPGWLRIFWIGLQLPLYMIHQLEEHAGDRFRQFTNSVIGGGVEVLSRRAAFLINSVGVWGVDLLALYLAVFVHPGWGLMAFYLPLVNAVGHIGQAVALKRYNPGLISSIALFLPLAGYGLFAVTRESSANLAMQSVGLLVAIAVHAAIIIHVRSELRKAAALRS